MDKKFIPSLHAFRGFAILNVVIVHAFGFALFFAGSYDENPAKWVQIFTATNEILFHNSTVYFALISGVLFSTILVSRGWLAFYKSKAFYVALPYLIMTSFFTWVHWTNEGVRVLFSGDMSEFLFTVWGYILDGSVTFSFWYMPVLLVLYILTPFISYLVNSPHSRIFIILFAVIPLIFLRTWPELEWTTFAYFIGIYAIGIALGTNYRVFMTELKEKVTIIILLAVLSTLVLVPIFILDLQTWGIFSLKESVFYVQKMAISALVLLAFERYIKRVPSWLDLMGNYAFSIFFLHTFFLFEISELMILYSVTFDSLAATLFYGSILYVGCIGLSVGITCLLKLILQKKSRYLIGS